MIFKEGVLGVSGYLRDPWILPAFMPPKIRKPSPNPHDDRPSSEIAPEKAPSEFYKGCSPNQAHSRIEAENPDSLTLNPKP